MLGGLDLLVNNAGMILQGGIEATPPAAWRELLAVNLTAAFLYSKACFGPLRDGGGGSIVHIVSDTGIRGIHRFAATRSPRRACACSRTCSPSRARR